MVSFRALLPWAALSYPSLPYAALGAVLCCLVLSCPALPCPHRCFCVVVSNARAALASVCVCPVSAAISFRLQPSREAVRVVQRSQRTTSILRASDDFHQRQERHERDGLRRAEHTAGLCRFGCCVLLVGLGWLALDHVRLGVILFGSVLLCSVLFGSVLFGSVRFDSVRFGSDRTVQFVNVHSSERLVILVQSSQADLLVDRSSATTVELCDLLVPLSWGLCSLLCSPSEGVA